MGNGNGWILMPLYLLSMVVVLIFAIEFTLAMVFLMKWLFSRKESENQGKQKGKNNSFIGMIVTLSMCACDVGLLLLIQFCFIAKFS